MGVLTLPLPKAKMKINKNGVKFESNVDAVQYTIRELSFAVLYDTAKFIRQRILEKLWKLPGLRKGKKATGAIQYWVRKIDCDLQIGYGNTKKDKTGATWYAVHQELGTPSNWAVKKNGVIVSKGTSGKAQPKRMLMRSTVLENLDTIRKIASQYFSALNELSPNVEEFPKDVTSPEGEE